MRGLFTCGVIDVFMENDIRFEAAAGISAGAVFGCNYKSRQIGRPLRYNKKYCKDPDFCYRELPDVLDPFDRKTFKEDPMEFHIGATDVKTGKCVFHKCSDGGEKDIRWMQASASMPIVSRPVEIDGNYYLDGGIADSIPYAYMESIGYSRNVIILTQPKGYLKHKSKASWLMDLALRKYPAVAEGMANRHEMYNRQVKEIEEREEKGTAFVIRPPEPIGIGRNESDTDELEKAYQMGRSEALRVLPGLKVFLS